MPTPKITITKISSNAGTVKPSSVVPAIIAPAGGGTANVPASFTRPTDAQASFLEGPLVEYAAYLMAEAQIPALLIKGSASTAGSYGAVQKTVTGTATPTAGSASALADDYPAVIVKFTSDTTLGTSGTYQVSLDGGGVWSPDTSLGTATTLSPTVPVTGADSGVRINLGSAAQTYKKGDSFTLSATGPRMNASDLTTALEALRVTRQAWDLVLVHGETSASAVSQIDTWLSAREAEGKFRTALVNTRAKTLAQGSTTVAETEAAYVTAMGTLLAGSATIRECVCSDGAAMVSPISGLTKAAPTSLYILARAESDSVGVDPAEVARGPVGNAQLEDANGNPLYHDEYLYSGLDDLRLSTLRSMPDRQGVYITNADLLSTSGSDYVYLQHARTMNRACEVAFGALTTLLSQGVRVNLKTGYILELQAAKWESSVQRDIDKELAGQVSGTKFSISRTDDISGNGPATITATIENAALKYVKNFSVVAAFVNTIGA